MKVNGKAKEKVNSLKEKKPKTKVKKKSPKLPEKPIQDYIIVHGNIYQANTLSERNSFSGFVHQMKAFSKFNSASASAKIKKKNIQKKANQQWLQNFKRSNKSSEMEKSLNMENYVDQLTKDQKLQILKKLEKQIKEEPPTKLSILEEKLETIKKQLIHKWQEQTQKINRQYETNQFTTKKYQEKINFLNKIKDQKLKIIECTRVLFQNILGGDEYLWRGSGIEEALKNLNSLSSFDQIPNESGGNSSSNSIKSEVQFEKAEQEISKKEEIDNITPGKKINSEESLLLSPETPERYDNFHCDESSLTKKLKIPLLMTKEKVQEIQADKKTKQLNKMREQIDRRISFQMSEVEEAQPSFTSLAGINMYIMQLYQFLIRCQLQKVVEKLNFPFGKSVRDKLCSLQDSEEVDEFELYPVLEDSEFSDFNREIALNVRRQSDYQKIHNKAVFDCFNVHLNAYRPYYELQGEVYPWAVSQKGITFYQINEQNIEEVFQKTKIKVLQFASSLCGLMPEGSQHLQVLKEKREELLSKEEKIGVVDEHSKWDIKIVNMEALIRLKVAEAIFQMEVVGALHQLRMVLC